MVLPGSVLITTKVPELAFFLPSLNCQLQEDKSTTKVPELAFFLPSVHCQLQEDKSMPRWCAFLGNVSATCTIILLVLFPAPNPHAGKGLVTLEQFLGCAGR